MTNIISLNLIRNKKVYLDRQTSNHKHKKPLSMLNFLRIVNVYTPK